MSLSCSCRRWSFVHGILGVFDNHTWVQFSSRLLAIASLRLFGLAKRLADSGVCAPVVDGSDFWLHCIRPGPTKQFVADLTDPCRARRYRLLANPLDDSIFHVFATPE
jgi:hypothetical protein